MTISLVKLIIDPIPIVPTQDIINKALQKVGVEYLYSIKCNAAGLIKK